MFVIVRWNFQLFFLHQLKIRRTLLQLKGKTQTLCRQENKQIVSVEHRFVVIKLEPLALPLI